MKDITYCSHIDCYYKDCRRHQHNAPKDRDISIADLDDGFCFIPESLEISSNKEKLLLVICKGIQNTHLKCDNPTRAVCEAAGDCIVCHAIAETIVETFDIFEAT